MKRTIVLGLALTVMAIPAAMAETAPADVAFDEDGAIAQSLSGAPGDPAAGAAVIGDRAIGNCVACHAVSAMPDVAFQGNVGPSLDGVADRWDEAHLRGILADAKKTYDGTVMPSFYKTGPYIRPGDAFTGKAAEGELAPLLSAQQVEDVVAYLLTLKE